MAIFDCETCGVPMVVSKEHGLVDGVAVRTFGRTAVRLCRRIFGERFGGFRRAQRTVVEHLHWHVKLREPGDCGCGGDNEGDADRAATEGLGARG